MTKSTIVLVISIGSKPPRNTLKRDFTLRRDIGCASRVGNALAGIGRCKI
jgi:hypothetical protein